MENPLALPDLIGMYNHVVQGIEMQAQEHEQRAYGGVVRAGKGKCR